MALSAEERASVAGPGGELEAECAFCGVRYLYAAAELEPR
jgi:redox-regulated HSP33 family molecular chaperone